ncbi:alpha/beta fold hydrolase [Nonomuraea sp. NPDC003754]
MQNTIWTEEFGDTAHPPVLLIAGSMSQGPQSWPDAFVGRLAAGGRRVIRYDHRDTGRSRTVDFASDPYTWRDLKDDALAVLDTHGIESAHIVGHSAGGLLAQWIAVDHPERVTTLTVIGSSPLGRQEGMTIMRALMGEEQPEGSLPPPAPAFVEFYRKMITTAPPATRAEQIDFQIAEARVLSGGGLPFDEDEERRQAERLHDRALDLSALANHRLAAAADMTFEPAGVLHTVKVPTLVIEGTHEPAKPGHGALIAAEIPGAELVTVEGMGHMLAPPVHGTLADAILAHTVTVRR